MKKKLIIIISVLLLAILTVVAFIAFKGANKKNKTTTKEKTTTIHQSTTTKKTTTKEKVVEYTISFDLNGGSGTIPNQKVIKGEKIEKPIDPTKDGYTFSGWLYKDEEWSFIGYVVTENMTLVANWTPNDNNLTLSKNIEDAGTITGAGVYKTDEEVEIIAETNAGYTFSGWFDGDNLVSNETNYSFIMPYNDLSYEARWTITSYTLTLNVNSEEGIVTGANTYEYGEEVTINATPNQGYAFDGWFIGEEKTEYNQQATFTMPYNDLALEARFKFDSYNVSVAKNINDAGSISGNGTYDYKSEVTLIATSKQGYTFDGWYIDDAMVETNPTYSFAMPNKNITIEARWTINSYELVLIINSEEGTATGAGTYEYGEEVTINAISNQGYVFDGWYKNDVKTDYTQETTITMPYNDLTIEARFKYDSYNVSVTKNIEDAGSITGNGAYKYKDSVTLSATTNPGYTFDGWYIDDARVEISNAYIFTMPNEDVTVEAKWTIKSYNLTLSVNSEEGSVTGSGTYDYGSNITISATANTGYAFDGWYRAGLKTDYLQNATITMPFNDLTLEAKFKTNSYTASVSKNIADAGTISGNGIYDYKSNVSLVAATNQGYTFDGWYKNDVRVETNSTYTFTMPNEDITVEARWALNSYTLTLNVDSEQGTVSGAGTYDYGSNITVSATANTGYAFDGWYKDDEKIDYSQTATFTMPYEDFELEARFILDSFDVTINVNFEDAGTVTGSGTYEYKSSVTIIIETNDGYHYDGLYLGEERITALATYTFTMPNEEVIYEARWTQIVLTSITISGQKTSFKTYDTFSFGGTVTANYNVGPTANVTSSSSFSGYTMSSAGNQTVVVTYEENNITKIVAYSITVSKAWRTTYDNSTGTVIFSFSKNSSGTITTKKGSVPCNINSHTEQLRIKFKASGSEGLRVTWSNGGSHKTTDTFGQTYTYHMDGTYTKTFTYDQGHDVLYARWDPANGGRAEGSWYQNGIWVGTPTNGSTYMNSYYSCSITIYKVEQYY